ncbi:hypothetical protein BD779DRAFT_283682 [Infundibulicybe gibba]|nr:hypothetical protein BD779DRAFT_283682 [Infundibulicybe gibba]
MAEVKAAALVEMFEHLCDLLGVLIALDETRVDVYPGARTTSNTMTKPHPELPACSTPDLKISDICTSDECIIIVVWPKATPGSDIMPSPIMDALGSAAARVANMTADLPSLELIVEKLKSNSKPKGSSPTRPPTNVAQDSAPAGVSGIVGAFLMTEARISELLMTGVRFMEEALEGVRARAGRPS